VKRWSCGASHQRSTACSKAGSSIRRGLTKKKQSATTSSPSFGRVGLFGLTIPRRYGGLELSATAWARIFAHLSTVDPSLAVLVGVHCGLGSKAIVLYGTDEQKDRYLPMLARGETLAAYALTEPETGSDAQNIRTRAELSADGKRWILNGHKIWIGNAHRAGVIATFAQTPVERRGETVARFTAFIITPDMPGFRVLGTVRKLGIRGSTQAELLATICVISRTQGLIEEKGLDACSREIELCDLFCVESGRRFRNNRLALSGHEEEVDTTRRDIAGVVRIEKRYFVKDAILEL
jgi:alkylation response protein AidB-like acyl-CoA dehydrogenase